MQKQNGSALSLLKLVHTNADIITFLCLLVLVAGTRNALLDTLPNISVSLHGFLTKPVGQ
jgi:hypothetical protein